jgi:hypothetical protein
VTASSSMNCLRLWHASTPDASVEPSALSTRELITAAATCAVSSVLFFWPLLARFGNWGIQDWDQHAFYHEAARVSLLEYGQLPQWNPYYCGGTDLLANPQSRIFSPSFAIVMLFGSVMGLKLEMILYACLGSLGFYCLGRQQGLDRLCAWLAPLVYFMGPFYALPNSTGMTWVMSVAYLPWVLLCYFESFQTLRAIPIGAACLALMYFGGGAYPVVITLTFLGFFSLLSMREHGILKTSASLLGMSVLMFGLGAVKFLPSIAFMREFPRHMQQPSGFSLESLVSGLFDHSQELATAHDFAGPNFSGPDRLLRGLSTDYDDVGMYIGPLVAALFLLGLAVRARRHWRLALSLPVFLWLSLGERPSWSLFELLHRLPVYESMRYSERFRLIWFAVLCLFAGHGLQWLRTWLELRRPNQRHGRWLAASVLVLILGDMLIITRPIYELAYSIPPLSVPRSPEFRQIGWLRNYDAHGMLANVDRNIDSSWSAHFPALLMNLGAVKCYETAFVPRQPTPMTSPDYRGEVYLLNGNGQVRTVTWTPNRLRYAVAVREPSWLIVNQNYYPSWKASDGRKLSSHAGLLAVKVTPADHVIELSYERASFYLGAGISALCWLGLWLVPLPRRSDSVWRRAERSWQGAEPKA